MGNISINIEAIFIVERSLDTLLVGLHLELNGYKIKKQLA